MPKQCQEIPIIGTDGFVCCYKMEGRYYVRSHSSLTRKKVLKHKSFEGTRRSAELLGRASTMARKLYFFLDTEPKSRDIFRKLVGEIKLMLKEGWEQSDIYSWFATEYMYVERIAELEDRIYRDQQRLERKVVKKPLRAPRVFSVFSVAGFTIVNRRSGTPPSPRLRRTGTETRRQGVVSLCRRGSHGSNSPPVQQRRTWDEMKERSYY